jgi:uncharacterized membrane protein YkoI
MLHNSVIVKNDIIVGKLPNVNQNDVILYNKKQTEKKLKEYTNSDKKQLAEIDLEIGKWAYGLGIKIDAHDILMLNDHIRKNFQSLNIFDIKVCVSLVISDSNLLKHNAEHYGKLTPIYVSKVLKSYQEYRGEVIFNVKQNIDKLEEQIVKEVNPKERLDNFKKLLIISKEENEKGLFVNDTGDCIYQFLKKNKLLDFNDEKFVKECMEFGEKMFQKDKSKSITSAIIKNGTFKTSKDFAFEKEDIVKRHAREYSVNNWLSKNNIQKFIEKINIDMLVY